MFSLKVLVCLADLSSELSAALLKRDFNLNVNLPPDRLCPPIPNRLDYILWIQDLLDASSCDLTRELDITRPIVGLDMYIRPSHPRTCAP